MKVLTGVEVLDLAIDRNPLQTRITTKSPISKTYYRASYGGITFTVDQAFMDAKNAGTIGRIVLNEGTRLVDDPLNPGTQRSVDTISFGSFANRSELLGVHQFDAEIKLIDHKVMKELTLTDADLKALVAAGIGSQATV